jgi:glutaredoxin
MNTQEGTQGGPALQRKVTLYTKDDCGLCEKAEDALWRLHEEYDFEFEIVDIERDEDTFKRYWDRVPVVAVDEEEVAAGPVDEQRLRALIGS